MQQPARVKRRRAILLICTARWRPSMLGLFFERTRKPTAFWPLAVGQVAMLLFDGLLPCGTHDRGRPTGMAGKVNLPLENSAND